MEQCTLADHEIVYSLIRDEEAIPGHFGCEIYGLAIQMGDVTTRYPRLTASLTEAGMLLDQLMCGQVTPDGLHNAVNRWRSSRKD